MWQALRLALSVPLSECAAILSSAGLTGLDVDPELPFSMVSYDERGNRYSVWIHSTCGLLLFDYVFVVSDFLVPFCFFRSPCSS